MAHQLRMPSLGQTTDELRIIAWLKAEGDAVALGEPILEVETDKAVLQVESSFAGTLLKSLRHVDEVVLAGEPVAWIGQPGEVVDGSTPAQPTTPLAAASSTPAASKGNEQMLATPVARKLAKDHGIDIATVRGSGPGGRIEKKDVEALINATAPNADEPSEGEVAVPRHRQIIAQRLTRSVQTIPQITLNATVDMRAAQAFISAQRNGGNAGVKITHLLLHAVSRALRAQPHMNRLWRSEGPVYRQLLRANVSLAVASEDNLIVATIPEPDQLDLARLVRVADEAIARARQGALTQGDLAPAAITISNLGMFRIDSFDAIIDPDQSMILAVGQISDQVVAINGGIHIVPQMALSLTVDHRVADGAAAAQFINAIRDDLERSAP
jgi:pyruvate dehydrogenase E2 component (dihydrolipoamide acetyltransferase)